MLKTMRKNVKALKPTLWIVVATFIVSIFVVWGGGLTKGEAGGAGALVSVGKEHFSADSYAQTLRSRLESMKNQFKELNRSFIEQLNIPQQVLEQMIEQALLFGLAKDMGIRASDEEVRDKIVSFPGLQQDGKFIGFSEYRQRLAWNRISLTDFENGLRKDIVLNKVVQIITAGVAITPDEVWQSYEKDKESAKIEYLALEKSKVELAQKPQAAEVQSYFDKHKDKYKIPEKREAVYVFLKTDDLKKEIELSESELESYYKANLAQFQAPERLKVSRIFLPSAGKDKALVQAEAQSVMDKIRKGEDFAALAKSYSKDNKAKDGGDWGLYDWQTLAAKEQEEIKKLAAGKVSDLITLDDGIALIKVTEKAAATTTPLTEAKPRIRSILLDQKARTMASDRISNLEKSARKEKSLEAAARRLGFKVQDTGLLKEGQAIEGIDPSGAISTSLFKLKEKEISTPVFSYGGVGTTELRKTEAPRPANFDEVKTDVESDVIEAAKKEKVLETIKEARAKLTDKNWEEIAQKYKLENKTVNEHKKEQYISVIGESPEIDQLAFSLPLKQVSPPIAFENGYALLRVLDRKQATREEFEKEKETQTNNLLETKKTKFLQSYLTKLRNDKGVKIKYSLYLQTTNDLLSRYEAAEK
jgi:peptidyl-prolyl cis-trans isomerase D